MAHPLMVSYGQNREDVVLWRALGHIPDGRYVEIGANHPIDDSMTWIFANAGWRGLLVEPVPSFAQLLRDHRPRDVVVEAAVVAEDGPITLNLVEGTGLSTVDTQIGKQYNDAGMAVHPVTVQGRRLDGLLTEHGFDTAPIHLLVVDVEGAEEQVLRSVDLVHWRPWVLVIEATEPNTSRPCHDQWEELVVGRGYRFCLFDGISRYYVADEHAEDLAPLLSYPACVLDRFEDHRLPDLRAELAQSREVIREREREVLRWRRLALTTWARSVDAAPAQPSSDAGRIGELEQQVRWAHEEMDRIHHTVSWRVTRPLRAVRRMRLTR